MHEPQVAADPQPAEEPMEEAVGDEEAEPTSAYFRPWIQAQRMFASYRLARGHMSVQKLYFTCNLAGKDERKWQLWEQVNVNVKLLSHVSLRPHGL